MTPAQFCSDIKRIYNRLKNPVDDLELKDRQIIFWLDTKRSLRIERFQNKMLLNDQFYQDFGCVPLCKVDKAECDSITYGCTSLKIDMPSLVFRPDMGDVLRVNMVDKISRIYYTTPALLKARLDSSIGRNFNWATMIGNTLYIIPSVNMLENFSVINIQAILSEPVKLIKYDQCSEACGFDFFNDNYPCPGGMMDEIKLDILTKELNIAMHMAPDEVNNSKDDK